jgi:hypothetical protein
MTSPSPLFIVGSPRSGTSLLVEVCLAAGFSGFREGNLLTLVKPLLDQVDHHFHVFGRANPKTLIGTTDVEDMRAAVLGIFKRLLDERNPVSPWFDKTCNPGMIYALPEIIGLWPGCRILFAKRRGIENVVSRLLKFPNRNFETHCRDWAANMAAWRETRTRLEPWRFIEVEQRDLVTRPDGIAAEIAGLLELGDAARTRIEAVIRSERNQQTAPGTAERILDLHDTGWTAQQIEVFETSCGLEMANFGYSTSLDYFAAP